MRTSRSAEANINTFNGVVELTGWALRGKHEAGLVCYHGCRSIWGNGHVPVSTATQQMRQHFVRWSSKKMRALLDRYTGVLWEVVTGKNGETISVYSLERVCRALCGSAQELHPYKATLPDSHASMRDLRISLVGGCLENAGIDVPYSYLMGLFGRCRNTLKCYLREAGVTVEQQYLRCDQVTPRSGKPTFPLTIDGNVVKVHQTVNTFGERKSSPRSLYRQLNHGRTNTNGMGPKGSVPRHKIDVQRERYYCGLFVQGYILDARYTGVSL